MSRLTLIRTLIAFAILFPSLPASQAAEPPIRFGLTAAVAREDLDLYDRWAQYLGRKVGRPVKFVQRRSYREAIELLENGENDFSWICSYPYAKYRGSNFFALMAVPVFDGKPLYRSYIIANKHSTFRTIADFKGRVFAYSDPDSNTGYVVPRQMINDLGYNPDTFFRYTFFTYSHSETIEAVAQHVADGAAVDSYVWDYLSRREPSVTNGARIIQRSETYGFPPLVYRIGIDKELRERMTKALLTMNQDPEGRKLLRELMLDRFVAGKSSLYDNVPLNADRR